MKRKWVNCAIIGFLGIIFVDAFPFRNGAIKFIKHRVDPIIDVVGIWQGPWDLFAPSIDKENHRIVVRYEVEGQADTREWQSPDWLAMNCADKFMYSRDIEFFDRIRSSGNSPAWNSFARYMKSEIEAKNNDGSSTVRKIEMGVIAQPIPLPIRQEEDTEAPLDISVGIFFTKSFPAELDL